MTLAPFVRILGRGPGRARDMTVQEAEDAMRIMLARGGDPHAVGALLMLLRMKGETVDEIAGFSKAAQGHAQQMAPCDLDWPSYAAGRTRGLPWFLLSARLVAQAGYRVLLHGWNGTDTAVRRGMSDLGVPVVTCPQSAAQALETDRIAYIPLENLSPELMALLQLRDVLGLRSCINTVARMLNPGRAEASVQGVFHPSYRVLQADAAHLLGWRALSVIKGGGGEFERHPLKAVTAFGLRDHAPWEMTLTAQDGTARRLSDAPTDPAALQALWDGRLEDDFAREVVLGTAEIALSTLGVSQPGALARHMWADRRAARAA